MTEEHRVRAGVYKALSQADPARPPLKVVELAVLLGFHVILVQRALEQLQVVGFAIELTHVAGWAITPEGLQALALPAFDEDPRARPREPWEG